MHISLPISRLGGVLALVAVGAAVSLAMPALDATAAASSRPWCTAHVIYQQNRNVYQILGNGLPGPADVEYKANVKWTPRGNWKFSRTEHYNYTYQPWFEKAIDIDSGDVTVINTKIHRVAAKCSITRADHVIIP